MKIKVIWSPLALDRVAEVVAYIRGDDPIAAERWAAAIIQKGEELSRFPKRGRIVPEFGRVDLREIFHSGHRIIYRVAPRRVVILTIRHGARLLDETEV